MAIPGLITAGTGGAATGATTAASGGGAAAAGSGLLGALGPAAIMSGVNLIGGIANRQNQLEQQKRQQIMESLITEAQLKAQGLQQKSQAAQSFIGQAQGGIQSALT